MKSGLLVQILLMSFLLVLAVPTNVFRVVAAPSYNPGVKAGDQATYANVTGLWQNNSPPPQSIVLTGAGSTFIAPLISRMASSYSSLNPNVQIDYQAIGSGAGVNALASKTIDFADSDAPLSPSQEATMPGQVLHIPDSVGAVAVAYNVPGMSTGLKLNATVIAEIFQGNITKWNDAAIAQLNPVLSLPNQAITPVHRADASGTTFIFTSYLATAAGGVWKLGHGNAISWSVGLGAIGNQGVAAVLQGTPYTVGYVELNYALSSNLGLAYLRNADGNSFVAPTLTNVASAITNSSSPLPMGNQSWASVSLLNAHGASTYPIVSFSYLLVFKDSSILLNETFNGSLALANFLWYVSHDGQQLATPLSYVPLPSVVVRINEASILSMTFQSVPLPLHLPTATIAIQPNATIDLARTMKQFTIEVALNNTPDVPPFNAVLIQLRYSTRVLTAASLDYSTNVFSQTTFNPLIARNCLDGLPANNGPSSLCGSDDGPGVTSFGEALVGGSTSDGTQGNIFSLTFNVNTTSPSFSQIRITTGILSYGSGLIATTNLDGYYSSLNCGGIACLPPQPNFSWSPKVPVQGTVVSFNGNFSVPSGGAVITDYFWTFGDTGSLRPYQDSGTSPTTAYAYQIAGKYSVTLTTTDSYGVKASKTSLITVVNPSPAGAPPLIAEFIHVQSINVNILTTSGSDVNAAVSFDFNNGTGPRMSFLIGNVATGSGNITFWILSGGLMAGDPIYNVPSATINRTDTEFFAGASRQVVHLTLGTNTGNSNFADWTWDQATGVLVSFDTRVFQQNGSNGFASVTISSTNLWGGGDFGISASPLFLIIHKANFYDPFAMNVSTISLRSVSGFSGAVQLQTISTASLGVTFSSYLVSLGPNQTATSILTISAANVSPGTYFVTVIGSKFTGQVLQHSVTLTVEVVAPPPDFQLYLSIPFGANFIFAGSATSIQAYLQSNGFTTFSGIVSLTGTVSPLVNNGPTLSFNPSVISFVNGSSFSQLTISTVATTPPGNYNITVIGTSGSLVHTAQFQLTVLPPPTITATPSSGPIGTQVTVHGSGFINPSQGSYAVAELEMTFDDQLVGLFFVQNSSFDFTFNVPVSQPGILHAIHAKELYPSSLDVQTSFFVQAQPGALSVTVSMGTIYFRGDTATIFAMTSLNGQSASVTSLQIILILPSATNLTLAAVRISNGVYKATFAVPAAGALGTYAVIVKAHLTGSSDAFALTSFEVKPTWLQSNGRTVTTASVVGAVGLFGAVALAWQKGYLGNRKRDSPPDEELRI